MIHKYHYDNYKQPYVQTHTADIVHIIYTRIH